MAQTIKQKREKALAYWREELKKASEGSSRAFYIKGQISTLEQKLGTNK